MAVVPAPNAVGTPGTVLGWISQMYLIGVPSVIDPRPDPLPIPLDERWRLEKPTPFLENPLRTSPSCSKVVAFAPGISDAPMTSAAVKAAVFQTIPLNPYNIWTSPCPGVRRRIVSAGRAGGVDAPPNPMVFISRLAYAVPWHRLHDGP